MIFATIIGGGIVVGFVPLDAGEGGSTVAIVATVVVELALCAVVALKGKISTAVIGMFIAPVASVAAIRLARPDSFWARRRDPGGQRQARQSLRDRKQRHDRRVRRFQDLIGGAPGRCPPSERTSNLGRLMPTPRSIQRTYYVLLLGNTLAASLIWGINTIFCSMPG